MLNFGYEPYRFELLYRPLYEYRIAFVWLMCGMITYMNVGVFASLSYQMRIMQASVSFFICFVFLVKGYRVYKIQNRLYGAPLEFIRLDKIIDKTKKYIAKDEFYLGEGYDWTPEQTQRAYEMLKLNWAEIAKAERLWGADRRLQRAIKEFKKEYKAHKASNPNQKIYKRLDFIGATILKCAFHFFKSLPLRTEIGQRWIHGLSSKTTPISIPASWLNGHLLILGTTGSGKTRFADLMITQCIMRGESLIIIDPKGDKEMKDNAKRACDTYRKYCIEHGVEDPGERFFFFHPAFPEDSVRLNLLANSARDTDITTRITNLIPSQSGLDPFTAFGWLSINAIVQALLYIGETPTISSIKVHLQDSMENLCSKALDSFCRSADQHEKDEKGELSHPSYDDLFNQEVRKMKVPPSASVQTDIKCLIYSTQYMTAPGAGNISSLVKLRNHPREHFSKMINNMLPLLDMLTVGTLGTMLSMSPGDDLDMKRETINTMDILDRKGVLYIGLDSLSDKMVGTAIGSLALSDIAASAGAIYNYRDHKNPVNIFVDEASECVNDSFIQILNKSRGAGFRLMVATQTISDFVAALGSDAKEEMVLGNINNVLALRTKNKTSQQWLSEDIPETAIKTLTRTQGINALSTMPLFHGATQSEQLKETTAPLLAPQIFGLLPNLEYIGIFAGGHIVKGKLPIIIGSDEANKKKEQYQSSDEYEVRGEIDDSDNDLD